MARRNKLLGLWAPRSWQERADADRIAKSVVLADFDSRATRMYSARCAAISTPSVSDSEIRGQMTSLLARAAEEVQKGS